MSHEGSLIKKVFFRWSLIEDAMPISGEVYMNYVFSMRAAISIFLSFYKILSGDVAVGIVWKNWLYYEGDGREYYSG